MGQTQSFFVLEKSVVDAITKHATAAYPNECCGMVVVRDGQEEALPIDNVQDELHATDPAQFPRTARTAYTMGPAAAPILMAAERGTVQLRAFFHSHPDHDAYFSEEDRRQAFGGWDQPSYPEAAQIVVSVRNRMIGAVKVFVWDGTGQEFVEVPLSVAGV